MAKKMDIQEFLKRHVSIFLIQKAKFKEEAMKVPATIQTVQPLYSYLNQVQTDHEDFTVGNRRRDPCMSPISGYALPTVHVPWST